MAFISLAGNKYVLAKVQGRDIYSSGKRVTQGIPSDDFEIVVDDWEAGMGTAYYYAKNCLLTEKGRIMPRPAVTQIANSTPTTPIRNWFEVKEATGDWYLYAISPTCMTKIDISADPPVIRDHWGTDDGTAPFDTAAAIKYKFGQPVKVTSTVGAMQTRWFVPCNADNTNDSARLTTVGKHPTADTWEVFGWLSGGVSHMVELGSGKVLRSLRDRNAQDTILANVALLAAGADYETNGNWSGNFTVGLHAYKIQSLLAFDELGIVGKQNNWFAAEEREDGTLRWRELLPDARYVDDGDVNDYTVHKGLVWHGRMYLPTPHNWWRHDLYGALPVGPDKLEDNPGDEPNLTAQIRGGVIPTGAHGGDWQYAPYNLAGGGFHIMAARERRQGERGSLELVWHPVIYESSGKCQGVHVQQNGVGGPRLWFGRGTNGADLGWIDLSPDLSPFAVGASFGGVSQDGTVYGSEYLLDSLGLLREQELEIENGNAELSWQPQVTRDGSSVENVGSPMTATGKSYWTPRTNDTARRIRPCLKWAGSGSYVPAGNKTRVRKWATRGTYLPSVADQIVCTVDVLDTVKLRGGVTEQNVRDELDALVKTGAKILVDLHERTHEVVVEDVQEQPAPHVAGLEGRHVAGVHMKVVEYS